jgi:hypothetical protein
MSPYRRYTPSEAEAALKRLERELAVYRSETERLAQKFAAAVGECLEAEATWGEVGQVLGMTKQAARAYWAPYLEGQAQLSHRGRFLRPPAELRPDERPGDTT